MFVGNGSNLLSFGKGSLFMKIKASLGPVWNWVCKRRNRRIVLGVLLLAVVLAVALGTGRKAEPEVLPAENTPIVQEAAPAPTPAPTPADPYRSQAEAVARVLYGIRENKQQDLRTYAWCIFNRVDNPSSEFDSTLEAVIAKPEQWMFYDPASPVTDDLYRIALEEVTRWHEGERPVSYDFVYAEWTRDDVVLRDKWEYTDSTRTWRFGQE